MANVINKTNEDNNIIYNVNIGETDSITLATANTYVDKNIIINTNVDLSSKADIDSPEFTGAPTAPTPSLSDNSTRIATTEFVKNNIANVALDDVIKTISLEDVESAIESVSTAQLGLEENLIEKAVKYYKFEFNELYGTDDTKTDPISAALTEIKFISSLGEEVKAANAFASSEYDIAYAASKVIDGKLNTMWSSKNVADIQTLTIVLEKQAIIAEVQIAPRKDIKFGVPKAFTIYASTDMSNWQQVGYYSNLETGWVDQNTFRSFSVQPYMEDAGGTKRLLDLKGLIHYSKKMNEKKANINSPNFSGSPTTTNPETDDKSDRIATTKFVYDSLSANTSKFVEQEFATKAHEQNMEDWSNLGMGLFIHWGVFACWGGVFNGVNENGEETNYKLTYNTEWLQRNAKIPSDTYKALSAQFTGENWNAEGIARLAYQAGMKYVILTAKHHEGFSLFSNPYGTWDIDDSSCRNTVIDELAAACKKYGLKFGLYFSQNYDWNEIGGFGREEPGYMGVDPWTEEEHIQYCENTINAIKLLVDTYNPFVIWYDMGFTKQKYVDMLLEAQERLWPDVIVNDRISSKRKVYGDFITAERTTGSGDGKYEESCFTLNNTWGYAPANDVVSYYNNSISVEAILKDYILDSIGKGQNCLLNIGPKPDGSIPDMQVSRLRFLSKFCQKYGTFDNCKPVVSSTYPDYGYMLKTGDNKVRFFIFEPDKEGIVLDGFDPTYIKSVRVFGADNEYSIDNYEVVDGQGIKLLSPLNVLSYEETVSGITFTNNANLGVVEIEFLHEPIFTNAKYMTISDRLSARSFLIKKGIVKKYRANEITIQTNGQTSADFIWGGDNIIANMSASISGTDVDSAAGTITITNCSNGTVYSQVFDDLTSASVIVENVVLKKGIRYTVNIKRTSGTANLTFTKVQFTPADVVPTYTEIDHIKSGAYQYIDTGYVPNSNTKVEVEFMQLANNTTTASVVVGLESPKFLIATDKTKSALRCGFGSADKYTTRKYNYLNNRYNMVLDKGKVYIDGVEQTDIDMSNQEAFTATSTLWLFADNGYPQTNVRFNGNLYMVKIWNGDELVRDFVPAKRDYDGVRGLLDKVNNVFYTSCTSDDFTE